MADTTTLQPDTIYALRLTRPVWVGPVLLRPRGKVRLKGSILSQIITDYGAEAVTDVTSTSE